MKAYSRHLFWSFFVMSLGFARGGVGQGNNTPLNDLPTGDLVIRGDNSHQLSDQADIVEKLEMVDLEQSQNYTYELSGQTSIHLKFKQVEGGNAKGTFVTRNESANPNTEIAYFNLARILGVESVFRVAIPHTLERRGIATFKRLIQNTQFSGMRARNARNTLLAMNDDPNEMKGCIKENKRGKDVALDSLVDIQNNRPKLTHPLFQDLNAANPKPSNEDKYEFRERYWAPRAKVAHEYSLMMTMDAVFGQWDRYSGSNVVFRIVDQETKEVEVYSTDNGGADFWNTTKWSERQASWFSRYDRRVIEDLKAVYSFLTGRATSLKSERMEQTWTDPKVFIVDMGLYYEKRPEQYQDELAKNIGVLLKAVQANYNRYGEAVFF